MRVRPAFDSRGAGRVSPRYRPPVIRAVLCDLDGVIRHWPAAGAARIEREHGLPAGSLARTAFAPALLERVTTGVIADEEWRERIATTLAADHGEAGRAAVARW